VFGLDIGPEVVVTHVMNFLAANHFELCNINATIDCTYHVKDVYIIFMVNVIRNCIRGSGAMDEGINPKMGFTLINCFSDCDIMDLYDSGN
jgi:hypothetical protein